MGSLQAWDTKDSALQKITKITGGTKYQKRKSPEQQSHSAKKLSPQAYLFSEQGLLIQELQDKVRRLDHPVDLDQQHHPNPTLL